MKIPIPRPTPADPEMLDHVNAVAQTLEHITGQEQGAPPLKPLKDTASLADAIAAVNAIIERLS